MDLCVRILRGVVKFIPLMLFKCHIKFVRFFVDIFFSFDVCVISYTESSRTRFSTNLHYIFEELIMLVMMVLPTRRSAQFM